jgi:MFS family permease
VGCGCVRHDNRSYRLWVEIVFTGFLRAGDNASQQAAMADLFGTRGQLLTQIASRDGMYGQVFAFFGPVIGEACASAFGRRSTFTCSAVLSALTMVLLVRTKETLKRSERKRFSIARANPLASMTLLFRLDRGLRSLAISQFLKDLSGSLMSVLNMFRMGPMQWTPQHVSRFKQFISPTIGITAHRHRPPPPPLTQATYFTHASCDVCARYLADQVSFKGRWSPKSCGGWASSAASSLAPR